ncbi:MAG: hypothetical protein ACI9MR_003334 [Myxococcota bacterium]|jgi:hypothetical protein
MKKLLTALAMLTLSVDLSTATAHASGFDDHRGSKMRLGVDLPILIPIGDFSDVAGLGLGVGLFHFEYKLSGILALTGRTGYLFHLDSNERSTWEFPFVAGIKFFISDLYLAGEMGLNIVGLSVDSPIGTVSKSDTQFATSLTAGYEIGDIDLRAGLWIPSLGDVGDGVELYFSAGYNFLYF